MVSAQRAAMRSWSAARTPALRRDTLQAGSAGRVVGGVDRLAGRSQGVRGLGRRPRGAARGARGAQRLGDGRVAPRRRHGAELHDRRQVERADEAVRQVVQAADDLGDTVHGADVRVGEGGAGQKAG